MVSIGCLYRNDARPGFYPLLAVMLLSLPALPRASTSLEFFFIWELITLSSYFLILRRREAARRTRCAICCSRSPPHFSCWSGFAMMPCGERQHFAGGVARGGAG